MVKKEMLHFRGAATISKTEECRLCLHLLKLSCNDGTKTRILAINNNNPSTIKYAIFPFDEINEKNVRLWYIENYQLYSDYVFFSSSWTLEKIKDVDFSICDYSDNIKAFIEKHINDLENK